MRIIIIIVILCVVAPWVRAIVLGLIWALYYSITEPGMLKRVWIEATTQAHMWIHGSKTKVQMPDPPSKQDEGKQVDEDEKTKGDYL